MTTHILLSLFRQLLIPSMDGSLFRLGRDVKTPHQYFMDNSLMAKIRRQILTCMAVSIKSSLLCMGQLEEELRHSPLNMDKYSAFPCPWIKVHLGLLINTRRMNIPISPEKLKCLVDTLRSTWNKYSKSFTILEGVTLLGHL